MKRLAMLISCIILGFIMLAGCGGNSGASIYPSPESPYVPPLPKPPPEWPVINGDGALVALIVEPTLERLIRPSLDQFVDDLIADGYEVVLYISDFTTPIELRSYLAGLYDHSGGTLNGAILIGDFPHAYQSVALNSSTPNIGTLSEEVISFQYYADLNGDFSASSGYISPGGHAYSFNMHRGDVDWEIWIGVLPLYRGNMAETVNALEHYFAKNHAYRVNGSDFPYAFLQIDEHLRPESPDQPFTYLPEMYYGEYAWTPFSSELDAYIYIESFADGLSLDEGYTALSAGVANFTVLDAHGSSGASGRLSINWIESHPIQTDFFWNTACASGDLDKAYNVLTSLLYSPTSAVIVAAGTTANSGGFGNNENGFYGHNIASALVNESSIGDAVLAHVNVPLIYPWSKSREFHFAQQVILGDPTLRIR